MASGFYSHFAYPVQKIEDLRCSWANELCAGICFEGSLRNPLLKFCHQTRGAKDNKPASTKVHQISASSVLPEKICPSHTWKPAEGEIVFLCNYLHSLGWTWILPCANIVYLFCDYWPVLAAQCSHGRSVQKSLSAINCASIWSSLPSQWFCIRSWKMRSILARR